jgi:ATP-dependent helicase/DNAse subunit B
MENQDGMRLSVSKVKTFKQCKKQYEFNYIVKLPKKDRDYHVLGKFCHRVLEWFHQQYIEGCLLPYNITMRDAFKLALSEYKDRMTAEMQRECWEMINQYLKNISRDKKMGMPANVIAVEKRFELDIGGNIVLNGAIDRIQLDDDNVLHVADYKTTKNKKYLTNDFFQLLTYAYVIASEDPRIEKVRASYILLRHDFEYVTTEFGKEEIAQVRDKFLDYANQMMTEKEFEPNPTVLCSYCDFLEHCPAGKSKAFGQAVYGEVNW